MGNNEMEIRENIIKALMLAQAVSLKQFADYGAKTDMEIKVATDMLNELYEEYLRRFGEDWGLAEA